MGVNEVDYVKIGRRIRETRVKKGWQQSELAHRANLTASHMSHIETAQTKLALPTLVKIANALSVSVDDLLCDNLEQVKPVYDHKIAEELADCDAAELQAFLEIIQAAKKVIRKNRKDFREPLI
jgi:transcriptional regulator with XRE-family HTH domain